MDKYSVIQRFKDLNLQPVNDTDTVYVYLDGAPATPDNPISQEWIVVFQFDTAEQLCDFTIIEHLIGI